MDGKQEMYGIMDTKYSYLSMEETYVDAANNQYVLSQGGPTGGEIGNEDIVCGKINEIGQIQWIYHYDCGGGLLDRPWGMEVDAEGSVYLVGDVCHEQPDIFDDDTTVETDEDNGDEPGCGC